MSRIEGLVLENSGENACGRLVPLRCDYDAGEKVCEARIPSLSRDNRVYGCFVDFISLEMACGCEAFQFRNAPNSRLRRDRSGTYLENFAFVRGYTLLPSILRDPSGLCPHLKKLRRWVFRHVPREAIETIEKGLIARLEEKAAREAAGVR